MTTYAPIRWICLIIAILLFLLAAFGVSLGSIGLQPLGLAFFAGAFLVPAPAVVP